MSLFKRLRKTTIRTKVTGFTLTILVSLLVGYLSMFYITLDISKNFTAMFSDSLTLDTLADEMIRFEKNLESYLNTKSSDSFVSYLDSLERLREMQKKLRLGLSHQESVLKFNGIGNMLDGYFEEASKSITNKRARNIEATILSFERLQKISANIAVVMDDINGGAFNNNVDEFIAMTRTIDQIKLVFIGIFVVVLLLGVVFIVDFTQAVANPIEKLSDYATNISAGNYDFEVETVHGYDEAKVLTQTFKEMSANIKSYVEALKDKAVTENKLRLTEVENLKMQNLLKQAELMALQSQINPHFLFNTINAGLQLAILEDADRTADFLDHMARMFRYNIQSLDNSVTLYDEIKNIRHYEHLMAVRFGEMLSITYEIDDLALEQVMPPLVLQPIVENALIHGLKDKEDNGKIEIYAEVGEDVLSITILDNGKGMDESTRMEMLRTAYEPQIGYQNGLGHTTGLGIANVYERLCAFYGKSHVLTIDSTQGIGTKVILQLPIRNR
ncbi:MULTISPECIES: sensor histidine kinase [unclassified Fusibacter]|uniref:sensor histidine kinase n=1 Tax=unclassified Fusibacter TaxID=2624464 RepID=UPI0013E923E0|nr:MULTISPECIES: histidine kinase [unclassified Fusibacter]MCK8059665.1 histidine kinase [Fusibacter sp. A2]NPE21466.1 histidine kinase [Fusibacter sp. A1]